MKRKGTLLDAVRADLARSGLLWLSRMQMQVTLDAARKCYRLPYFNLDGSPNGYYRDRFLGILPKDGKRSRYIGPKGEPPRLYFPPIGTDWQKVAGDPEVALLVTEGEKKSAAATKAGFPTVGLGGVDCWRSKATRGPIADLDLIEWQARRAFVVFDSDAATNGNVQRAESALAGELRGRGAHVHIVRLPVATGGGKQGLDDFLLAHGPGGLRKLLDKSAPSGVRVLTASELMAMDFPEQQWVIPNLIPAGLTLLVGRPKIGKSWMVLQLGIAKAQGWRALGNYRCSPGQVLWLALEDTPRRVKNRLKKLLNGGKVPPGLHITTNWPRADQGGIAELRTWLDAHPEVQLVIIDTLAKVRNRSTRRDGNVYLIDYDDISEFKALADERGIGMVIVHHLRKSLGISGEDPLEQISGTTGISGATDTAMILKRKLGEDQGTLVIVGRDIAEQELAVQFSEETRQWEVLGDVVDFKMSDTRRKVLKALAKIGHPATPKEVAELTGGSREAVKVTMNRMQGNGQLRGMGDGKYLPAPFTTPPLSTHTKLPGTSVTTVTAVTGSGNTVTPEHGHSTHRLRLGRREAA